LKNKEPASAGFPCVAQDFSPASFDTPFDTGFAHSGLLRMRLLYRPFD
jgi:hypothetical protein